MSIRCLLRRRQTMLNILDILVQTLNFAHSEMINTDFFFMFQTVWTSGESLKLV